MVGVSCFCVSIGLFYRSLSPSSHPTRSGRVRVSSEQWVRGPSGPAARVEATSRAISRMAVQSSGRSVWLRPEWMNKILPRCPTTSVSGKICGAELS